LTTTVFLLIFEYTVVARWRSPCGWGCEPGWVDWRPPAGYSMAQFGKWEWG